MLGEYPSGHVHFGALGMHLSSKTIKGPSWPDHPAAIQYVSQMLIYIFSICVYSQPCKKDTSGPIFKTGAQLES